MTYDHIPYTKHIYQHTQPNHLATLATLFGLQPPPVPTCRVLELGCASGVNTMAMAQTIPHGQFLGIDGSAQQILTGQQNIRDLGLTNIVLQHLNILDITPQLGQFDYIVAHGVYSWVPPLVREKLLQICSQHLQPNGIAYVSYNIYPGWSANRALREMILYRTLEINAPKDKLEEAKRFLQFLIHSIKDKFDSYSLSLRKELDRVSQLQENYFFHEYLEEDNDPVFFHELIAQAQHHGLQYVTDAKEPFVSLEKFLSHETNTFGLDVIEKEQYLDFLRNNSFRETLLCHLGLPVRRTLDPQDLDKFYLASSLKPASPQFIQATSIPDEAVVNEGLEKFMNAAGEAVVSIASPLLKAVCLALGEVWPQCLTFVEILQTIKKSLRKVDKATYLTIMSPDNIQEVKTLLLEFHLKKIIELHVYPPQFTTHISDSPLASPLARLISRDSHEVPNLRHETIQLDFATGDLLGYLDGTRNRQDLLDLLWKRIEEGKLLLYQGGDKKMTSDIDRAELQKFLVNYIEEGLQTLARKGFLMKNQD